METFIDANKLETNDGVEIKDKLTNNIINPFNDGTLTDGDKIAKMKSMN